MSFKSHKIINVSRKYHVNVIFVLESVSLSKLK